MEYLGQFPLTSHVKKCLGPKQEAKCVMPFLLWHVPFLRPIPAPRAALLCSDWGGVYIVRSYLLGSLGTVPLAVEYMELFLWAVHGNTLKKPHSVVWRLAARAGLAI